MRRVPGIAVFSLILFLVLLALIALAGSGWGVEATIPSTAATSTAEALLHTPVVVAGTPALPPADRRAITGRVVSLDGEPVTGARVFTSNAKTESDDNGWFQLPAGRLPQWITVEHPDFLSRTRAAAPDSPVLLRLTPDDGETVSLHFVGDTMFGRRFYDPNEDGNPNDGLLRIGDGAAQHLALLSYVQPLLANADITTLNLESSLAEDPYIDPTGPRPANYHPTKDYIFSTHTSAAVALRQAGVDVIDVANNHVYDALDAGVVETLNALAQAGFQPGSGYFGAGLSEEQAWKPAVVVQKGQAIAFLGCTTITYPFVEGVPQRDAVSYFASDAEGKGGAARCQVDAIRQAVEEAVARYDVVIFMIHGGSEYERAPTAVLVEMTNAAREAGATLVIDHQTHVVSGLEWDGRSLVAWSLGNFVFDQTVWPTFETYLLAVHLRRGAVVRAYAEPLIIEGYLPKGLTGDMAEYVARGAAGRTPGSILVENGTAEVDVAGAAVRFSATVPVDGDPGAGTIFRVSKRWWVSDFVGDGDVRLGRDLLWVGSFEDEDVDADYQEGTLWDLAGPNKYVGVEYAYEGDAGARIQRGARDEDDIVLTPLHRIPVGVGAELSVVGRVRTSLLADLSLQLSWFPDTRGPSDSRFVRPIIVHSDDEWETFRFDVTVPPNTVAVGLYLRLSPPATGFVTADFDNLRIIEWAPAGAPFSMLYDYVRVLGDGRAVLSQYLLRGGEFEAGFPELSVVAR